MKPVAPVMKIVSLDMVGGRLVCVVVVIVVVIVVVVIVVVMLMAILAALGYGGLIGLFLIAGIDNAIY